MFGDSKLIISFMNKQFNPGKKSFVVAVEMGRRICKLIKGKVFFYHIYRENNIVADFLSKIAIKYNFSGDLNKLYTLIDEYPVIKLSLPDIL